MKIKALMITAIAVLTLGAFVLSGCTENGSTGGGGNNPSASDSGSGSQSDDNDGEYKNDDGFFNNSEDSASDSQNPSDSSDPLEEGSDNSGSDNSGADKSDMSVVDIAAARIGLGADDLRSTLIGWGLGRERDSLDRPLDALNAQKKYGGYSSLFIDDSGEKTVYLTFDEGYENGYTAAILDTLKEAGVKAVFFVTYDYCVSAPDLVERMIAEGHTVGNHSYSHPSFPECSEDEVKDEVMLLHDYVKENFGYEMTLFRFPKGEFSEKTLFQLDLLGYTSVFWSFAYVDWNADRNTDAKEAFDTITSATHSGGIYLLHAVSQANADCLGDVINYWKNNGYTVGDLNKLAAKELT
ncbi:MAG: polysaccharide deacetylase family protein [Oscillospiraceae bacterium]|nr:polysaccharide deacetylase family protein [Oscillospiraceae bacterium]